MTRTDYSLPKKFVKPDPHLWASLTFAEGIVSEQINKLSEFSDLKSPQLMQLVQIRAAVNRLVQFANNNGLGMKAIG